MNGSPGPPRPDRAPRRSAPRPRFRAAPLYPYLHLGLFLAPALALAGLEGPGLVTGLAALAGAAAAGILGRPRFEEYRGGRVPAAILSVTIPVVLAPGGLLEVLLAAASGLGVLAWITTITDAPMGPGRRRAGLTVPLIGVLATLATAFATPGLSAGPGFTALLVVLAIFVAAIGLLGGAGPARSEVEAFEDLGTVPTP